MITRQHPLFSGQWRCDIFAYGRPLEIFLVMKQTTTAVINLINAARAAPDAPIAFAECFTFITTTGTQYTWTNVDYHVRFNGLNSWPTARWSPASNTRDRSASRSTSSKSRSPPGRQTHQRRAIPDRAARWRVRRLPCLSLSRLSHCARRSVIGGVRMFQGRISTVDNVGRTQATVTVARIW